MFDTTITIDRKKGSAPTTEAPSAASEANGRVSEQLFLLLHATNVSQHAPNEHEVLEKHSVRDEDAARCRNNFTIQSSYVFVSMFRSFLFASQELESQ